MAIFIRREIQAAVNRVAASLMREQLADLVDRLNGPTAESLAAEWEAIILSAFYQCGRITYEPNFGGETRPDLLFQLGASGGLEFLADIRMVSDKASHEKNPFDGFCEAIRGFLLERGHSSTGLHIDVQHSEEGEFGKRKIRLALPAKADIGAFVENELCQFLSGIVSNPDRNHSLHHDKNGVRFSIRYDASEKKFSRGGHIAYAVPFSSRNPLTNALINKGAQLMKSGYAGAKGIIICDGGCESLSERPRVGGAFPCQDIVEGYLRAHTYILWVLVLRVEQLHSLLPRKNAVTVQPKLHWNPARDKRLFRDTRVALARAMDHLPRPESTPTNAIHWLDGRNGKLGQPLGGYSMKGKTIKISARALTELLAGRIEPQRFRADHGIDPDPQRPSGSSFPFFERQITSGNTIQNAFVEKDNHKDDDWIVLEYGGPDPAMSPYRIPK